MRFLARSTRVFALIAICFGMLGVAAAQEASAAPAPKVTICHATNSAKNPYNLITVSQNAIPAHEVHQGGRDGIPAPAQGCGDICPNVPGHQLQVPDGLVVDANGDCVPADVCPNLPDNQAEVPDGYILDANGNCIPEPQPCNSATLSGGEGTTVTVHELGQNSGTFQFDYETYSVEDQIIIKYEGNEIFNVGPVGTNGVVSTNINYGPGTSTQIEVTVIGPFGTAWDYTVNCPAPPS